jgi:chaperonin cofactor prefoldin
LWSGSTSDERQPTVEHQIEETVCPVLDELDTIYEYTSVDYTIGVEVGVETVSHEMSWVEVEDELDRLFQEVDSIVD